MVKCGSCGNLISKSAKVCPHCGNEYTPAKREETGATIMGCIGLLVGAGVGVGISNLLHLSFLASIPVGMVCALAGAWLLAKGEFGRFTR